MSPSQPEADEPWRAVLSLPVDARKRLASDARASLDQDQMHIGRSHTLPLRSPTRAECQNALLDEVSEFNDLVHEGPAHPITFKSTARWLSLLVKARRDLLEELRRRSPFEIFDADSAIALVSNVDSSLLYAVDFIEEGIPNGWLPPRVEARGDRKSRPGDEQLHPLARLFGLQVAPIDDEGRFDRSSVLRTYAYKNGALVALLAPHLESLGVPATQSLGSLVDALATVVGAGQPLIASDAFRLTLVLLGAHDTQLVESVLQDVESNLPNEREGERRRTSLRQLIAGSDDPESVAIASAELYASVLEGPFRTFGWAVHCLQTGSLAPRPTLSNVCDALGTDDGWLASVVARAALVEVRNGVSHQEIHWDGFIEQLLVRGEPVALNDIDIARSVAESLVGGIRMAIRIFQTSRVVIQSATDLGTATSHIARLDNAGGYFATNRLELLASQFNSRTASIKLKSLQHGQINPCFQAIMNVARDLPGIEAFDVRAEQPSVSFSVSRRACELTTPVWQAALSHLSAMPLSTFLPLNYCARLEAEGRLLASRAVAWISIDDALDGWLDQAARDLRVAFMRIQLARHALEQTALLAERPAPVQLAGRLLDDLLSMLRIHSPGSGSSEARLEQAFKRVADLHAQWGPVPRLPGVPHVDPTEDDLKRDYRAGRRIGRETWTL
ncbi:MAG: hypothetical protein PIR02_05925 [Microbacterium enclense]